MVKKLMAKGDNMALDYCYDPDDSSLTAEGNRAFTLEGSKCIPKCEEGREYRVATTGQCAPCSDGMDCEEAGNDVTSLKLKAGYWRPSVLGSAHEFDFVAADADFTVIALDQENIDLARARRKKSSPC